MNTVEPLLLGLMVPGWTSPTDGSCARHREFMVGWVHRVLGNLERWFAAGERSYVATPEFTVADVLIAHVLHSGIKDEALIAPYPALVAYRSRCLARPAWQRTVEAYEARGEAG